VAVAEGFVGTEAEWLDSLHGPVGPPGGSYTAAFWDYHNGTSPPPSTGEVRTDEPVTTLWISEVDADGFDRSAGLAMAAEGDTLQIRSEDGGTYALRINGTPTDQSGWWSIPVEVVAGDPTPKKNARIQVALIRQAGGLDPADFVSIDGDTMTGQLNVPQFSSAGYTGVGGPLTVYGQLKLGGDDAPDTFPLLYGSGDGGLHFDVPADGYVAIHDAPLVGVADPTQPDAAVNLQYLEAVMMLAEVGLTRKARYSSTNTRYELVGPDGSTTGAEVPARADRDYCVRFVRDSGAGDPAPTAGEMDEVLTV
jgi:hypothetical protein